MKKKHEKIVNADSEEGQMAGEAMVEIIENQLAENNPPETRLTLDRLMGMGETRENAMRYIASVLSVEIFHMLKEQEMFDEARYVGNLKALPTLPDA